MVDFFPINLCNVLYKLIYKVMANIIKLALSVLISDSQYAFVLERQIIDNILVAYELIHSLRMNKKEKQGTMFIQLDMNKAYDQVE